MESEWRKTANKTKESYDSTKDGQAHNYGDNCHIVGHVSTPSYRFTPLCHCCEEKKTETMLCRYPWNHHSENAERFQHAKQHTLPQSALYITLQLSVLSGRMQRVRIIPHVKTNLWCEIHQMRVHPAEVRHRADQRRPNTKKIMNWIGSELFAYV